jgi:hypothetical protein
VATLPGRTAPAPPARLRCSPAAVPRRAAPVDGGRKRAQVVHADLALPRVRRRHGAQRAVEVAGDRREQPRRQAQLLRQRHLVHDLGGVAPAGGGRAAFAFGGRGGAAFGQGPGRAMPLLWRHHTPAACPPHPPALLPLPPPCAHHVLVSQVQRAQQPRDAPHAGGQVL